MSLIEVILAVVIMGGVMIGLSRFGQRFQRISTESGAISVASDLAVARLEAIRTSAPYDSLVPRFHGTLETSATGAADPPMVGFGGFTRTTAVARDSTATRDLVRVTVTVSGESSLLPTPVRKTTVIARF